MQTNEIRITIKAPPEEVFEYTIEPKNTKYWVTDSVEMKTDTEQIDLGTKYSNEYATRDVIDYERDKFIELADVDGIYSCSYTFRKIDNDSMELIFFESNIDGSALEYPLSKKSFNKLKEILETN
jgi:hypothetical protein